MEIVEAEATPDDAKTAEKATPKKTAAREAGTLFTLVSKSDTTGSSSARAVPIRN